MIKHCCDVCGSTIDAPHSIDGYSGTNLIYKNDSKTTYLELCGECMNAFEALLKLRKGFVNAE